MNCEPGPRFNMPPLSLEASEKHDKGSLELKNMTMCDSQA